MAKKNNWLKEYKSIRKVPDSKDYVRDLTSSFPDSVKTLMQEKRKEQTKSQKVASALDVISPINAQQQKYLKKRIGFNSEYSYQKLRHLALVWDCSISDTMERLLTDAWVRIEATDIFNNRLKELQLKKEEKKKDKREKPKLKKVKTCLPPKK